MIKKTKYLSQAERETGRKYYYRFVGWNGIGFSFLGNTSVYLMAILYGANNTQLGYISSVTYITGITLLFYTKVFDGRKLRSVGSIAWLLRGLVCLGYLALPLLSGPRAVYLILTIYTLFCATRAIGVAVQQNIQKMISTSRTRGEVVMAASTRFNTVAIFSRIFTYFVTATRYVSELTELLVLQVMGVVCNTMSALAFRRVPSREVITHSKGRHVGRLFQENMSIPRERRVLLVRWCSVGVEILAGMSIPFLRKYADFSAPMIFLYTIVITLAAIAGAQLIKPFADRLGSRPFILPITLIIGGLFVLWMTADTSRSPEFFYILGFLTVMFQTALILLASRLFIQIIPEEESTGFTSMDVFVTSILAFFLGFSGGYLADLSESVRLPFLNTYGLTFFMGVLLCLVAMITAARFEEKGSSSLKKTWTMLFSVDHLRTFRDINRLNTYNTPLKRKSLILSLGYSGSSLANDEIRQIFLQPLSPERGEIIKSLFVKKRPQLVPELLREAADSRAFNRQEAIFALGAYPREDVEGLLVRLIGDDDALTASNAAKSLGRIGNKDHYDALSRRFHRERKGFLDRDLNYLIAFHKINPQGEWLEGLFSEETIRWGETYVQNFVTLAARQMNLSPPLGWIYQKNNDVPGEGMAILLDEAREMELFFRHKEELYRGFAAGDYPALWEWCRGNLQRTALSGAAQPLGRSINAADSSAAGSAGTLGAVYFCYHIFKNGGRL